MEYISLLLDIVEHENKETEFTHFVLWDNCHTVQVPSSDAGYAVGWQSLRIHKSRLREDRAHIEQIHRGQGLAVYVEDSYVYFTPLYWYPEFCQAALHAQEEGTSEIFSCEERRFVPIN